MRHGLLLALAPFVVSCGTSGNDGIHDAAPPLCAPTHRATPQRYSDADEPIPRHFFGSTDGTVLFTDNTPRKNPITNAGAALGRVLFYDVRLSADDRVSCASCHRQAFGFGDTARFSPGVRGRYPERRTMALANARFNPGGRFFWDERAPTLEEAVLQPIQDTLEMAMPLDTLERKLAATPFYPPLFAAAFGTPDVTREEISLALSQFVRSLVSARSRYDAVFATGGAPDTSRLTGSERAGMRLFTSVGCVNCHRTIAQVPDKANDSGLDSVPGDSGAGQGRFKPPSLRNIAVRPPYMHDGRFRTLREVVEFYDHGVRSGPWLDPRLLGSDSLPRRLHLTPTQVEGLVAFLQALTDSTFLEDARLSDPFRCATPVRRAGSGRR